MDYFKIVLDGYFNSNNRKFLTEYFVREQKKAKKDFYSTDEFFSGCDDVIEQFSNEIKRQLFKEKNDCHFAISHIKNGTMNFSQSDKSKTYEEQCEQALISWEKQLNSWTIDSFSVNLFSMNIGYTGYLWHNDLLLISDAIEKAKTMVNENTIKTNSNNDNEFIDLILKGIKELQTQDQKAECIKVIKTESKKLEAPFCIWFKTFFSGKYTTVNAEPEKGNGRIDLKIEDLSIGTKIIEFKGWWNPDKKQVVSQILSYLTDFETDGYIVIINNNQKKIDDDYFDLIKSESVKYVENSFEEIDVPGTGYKYFISNHSDRIRTKRLYHFILNVYSTLSYQNVG